MRFAACEKGRWDTLAAMFVSEGRSKGTATNFANQLSGSAVTDDTRVTVIGPERLAELVVDAGLVGWLIRKVS